MSPHSSRILLVGDIHLSDRPPSSCTETYLEDLFVLLEHSVDKARELDVDAVVWAGDVFHHKQPSRTSHATVQRAIALIQTYGCPLFIVPGNHDMQHDRFDSLEETQPLGTLLKAGARLLRGWDPDGLPIYGVPWSQRWEDEDVEKALSGFGGRSDGLVIAHAPLYPPGLELTYEFYPVTDWADRQGNAGYCYYGHVHEAHGIYERNGVTFCNVGAITRGSLHESELKRAVKLALWDQESGFREVDIPHRPADEVFRLMEKREIQDTQIRLDEFLASVGESSIEITSIETVVAQIKKELPHLPESVISLIEELLTQTSEAH